MELTILERLMLLGILPETGDLKTIRVVHDLRMALALTPDEIKEWEVEDTKDADGKPSGVKWNEAKVAAAEIDVAGIKTTVIVEALRKLDSEKKLAPQHLTLCEKFPFEKKD